MAPQILLRLSVAARVLPAGANCVCWMRESSQGILEAVHAGTLVSLLDHPRSSEDLLAHFSEGHERSRAAEALEKLIARGLLESASLGGHIAEFCQEWGIAPQLEQRNRYQKGATLCDLGADAECEALREALMAIGLPVRPNGQLQIVAVRDYLNPRLSEMPARPWMPVKLAGEEVWIGPVFIPGRTACWRCLELRLRERAWLSSQIEAESGALWTPRVSGNRLRAAAEFAAQETARWMMEAPVPLEGSIWSLNWANLKAERHLVVRRPDCPACGTRERSKPTERSIAALKPNHPPEGPAVSPDLRTSPQAILDRLEPFISPITGIVRRLERRDLAASAPVFTYGGIYNLALPPPELRMPGAIIELGVCSGRGLSADEAKAACLAEAVERYAIQFRGDERRITASYVELGDAAIHPNRVQLFSERQFAGRDKWNRNHVLDELTPEPFDEDETIEWIEGWSLTTNRARYLPMALTSLYYRPPGKRWIGDADSNGCAAGSSFEEAVLHALLELVERDAVSMWWFNRISRPHLELQSLPDPLCRRVCGDMQALGWDVWAEEITTDFGIPVFLAIANRPGGWIYGSAAHLDPRAALRAAIGELWQLSRSRPRKSDTFEISKKAAKAACVFSSPVQDCRGRIERAGLEVVVFDMTRPEIEFPVVRVVAPGLRSKRPRFAAGRLYDIPVRLGWLEDARSEEELAVESA